MDNTGKACVEFLKWAPKKGLMNAHTATAMRVACSQVLGVLENWENLDVAALDTEDVFTRFMNLKGKNFKPESLTTYKSRFTRGIAMFLEHSKNPAGYKPKIQSTQRRTKPVATNGTPDAPTAPHVPDAAPPSTARTGLVDYPFPLREGRFAYLKLPADLTAADVKRLTAYLNTLALEERLDAASA
jgi:hypothetical protein